MKKRVVALFLAGVLSASALSGCGKKVSDAVPSAATEEVKTEAAVETASSEEEIPDVEVAHSETYKSPDGWSVEYDTEMIAKNEGEDEVSFVYQGEAAGTCMLSIRTEREKKSADVIDEIKKNNPDADNIDESESTLAGTDLQAHWIYPQYKEGNGLTEDYIVVDLNDDITLVFDFLTHKSGDDEIDIPVSDYLAMIVDSFQYDAASAGTTAAAETEEASEAEELKPLDISGCDTFTQIVDSLEPGRGYANAQISGEDVLLVSSGVFDNDGVIAAIDSEIFYYKDGVPTSLGIVECGGTAYPLAIKDGLLYVGQNHGLEKYAFEAGKLTVKEAVAVDYDSAGNESYSYSADGKVVEKDNEEAEKKFTELFNELEDKNTEILEFNEVSKGIADAWKDITEKEAKEKVSDLFVIPSNAKNVSWTMLEDATEANGKNTAIVDAQFELDGTFYDARAQVTGDDYLNIAGLDYKWTVEDDVTLANWAGGNMKGKSYRYVGDNNMVDVITWYDVEKGISYSLSVAAEDLDGFDIQACAEQISPETAE